MFPVSNAMKIHVVSLGSGNFQPLLRDVLLKGGQVLKNGEAAIYTSDGLVFGMSEVESHHLTDVYPRNISELETNSTTRQAHDAVVKVHGTVCPSHTHVLSLDGRLSEVRPFDPEDWGIPDVSFRMCQLVTFPRANLYAQLDKASETSEMVYVVAGVGAVAALGLVVLAISLSLLSHRLEVRRRRALRQVACAEGEARRAVSLSSHGGDACPRGLPRSGQALVLRLDGAGSEVQVSGWCDHVHLPPVARLE